MYMCVGLWLDSPGVIAGGCRQRRVVWLAGFSSRAARRNEEEAECCLRRQSGLGVRSCTGTQQRSLQKE